MNTNIVKKLQTALPNYPIEKAWLFGSYARGEETRKSDVDVLVHFDRKNKKISLFDHIRITHSLQDLLHKKVDLVEDGCLYKFAQNSVENDKILIYERRN
ncbi:MAG: nucleotidyltransferase domain-containing protein [Prevotellaceae bacterium]|jgi:predicted nucleotidyltransferase|nr:nucleotidyltransferase domain-containing protein [Prevotellaceae bacterium]